MNTYILVSALVVMLMAYGIYKLFKRRSKNQTISEEELKPYFEKSDLVFEEKVRKQWLTSFFVFFVTVALTRFAALYDSQGFDQNFLFTLGLSSIAFVTAGITYSFSYKKRGTAWLAWILGLMIGNELIDIKNRGLSYFPELDLLEWITFTAIFGLEVYFWINCMRLWKVNLNRKKKKSLALKEKYSPVATDLCSTQN